MWLSKVEDDWKLQLFIFFECENFPDGFQLNFFYTKRLIQCQSAIDLFVVKTLEMVNICSA